MSRKGHGCSRPNRPRRVEVFQRSVRVSRAIMMHSAKLDVVGAGLNAADTVIRVAHYPESGAKVDFRSAQVLLGGQVAAAMIACQQWGLRTRYVGKVGDDSAAEPHRAEFAR